MVGWWDVKQSMKKKWKQIARKKFKTRRVRGCCWGGPRERERCEFWNQGMKRVHRLSCPFLSCPVLPTCLVQLLSAGCTQPIADVHGVDPLLHLGREEGDWESGRTGE